MSRLLARLLFGPLLALAVILPAAAEDGGPPWSAPLAQDHPLVGRIWLPAEHRFVPPTELSRLLAAADFVLLGERHDNPDHHRLQAWALGKMVIAGRRPVVAFEMIGPEQSTAFDRQRMLRPDDVDGLATALDWSHSNWPDWAYYRPLFAEAIASNLPVRAANLPRDTMRAIARGQPLADDARLAYRLDRPLPPPIFQAMAEEIRQSHCGQLPETAVAPMVDVQRARDAAMAHALSDDTPAGAVLIAGAGHTRTDRGVPWQLATLAAGRTVFSLAFIEVADDSSDPKEYGAAYGSVLPPFDAVWFTPRASDDDPCAEMMTFMKRKAEQQSQ
ncbi:ChaN family lipoprotein [Telmatospirillum sp.]|uniref:ChaN family lipoprotein n=1 Tax=Telmatospirillum sp. TaxID=2079197 RepID=UPI00284D105F|nr:ChaN family lipoprotein [Telmatospirillum sp.]MDR3435705.1 ChaN family lipoprotein [Telmatospirillum sp.]